MRRYKITLGTDRGVPIYTVDQATGGLDYTIVVNAVGRINLTLDALAIVTPSAAGREIWPGVPAQVPVQINVDMTIKVERSVGEVLYPGAGGATIPGPLVYEHTFLVKEWTYWTDDQGHDKVTISGPDMVGLLTDEFVAYKSNTATGTKTGPADDVMKAFVRENLGPSAGSRNRNSAYWSVEPDLGLGATITIDGSKLNLLELCQKCCEASRTAAVPVAVYFDVVARTETAFEFRTFKGQRGRDRSVAGPGQLVLSADRGSAMSPRSPSLVRPKLTEDWDEERNRIYTTGIGAAIDDIILRKTDDARSFKSIWGRRTWWEDTDNDATTEGVAARAQAALAEHRPRRRFEADIGNVVGAAYGSDFQCGDRLAASYRGAVWVAVVNGIHVSVDASGTEKVTAHITVNDD